MSATNGWRDPHVGRRILRIIEVTRVSEPERARNNQRRSQSTSANPAYTMSWSAARTTSTDRPQ